MTSHTGKQVITIHILPNISKSKGNHVISHLIACKVKKYFSSKIMQKMWQGD